MGIFLCFFVLNRNNLEFLRNNSSRGRLLRFLQKGEIISTMELWCYGEIWQSGLTRRGTAIKFILARWLNSPHCTPIQITDPMHLHLAISLLELASIFFHFLMNHMDWIFNYD